VTFCAGKTPLTSPPPIAVHNDGDVAGDISRLVVHGGGHGGM
jgi:hypothetical protein